ncbi:hypothetical protein OZ411_03960 [Bradyrhizobium sp. Arg237L]|uniref:hypothetical protein n=1 Tax=Bradyrhizobium sp. Arg237L TaxID=3003352 RepID=UPI00249EE1E3|nr:hypothetical protein [Bradyrhizobium sp. Arg237L]MDI4231968.1 hypothetical protein [Bradyrhizobium sp. Arg237L]
MIGAAPGAVMSMMPFCADDVIIRLPATPSLTGSKFAVPAKVSAGAPVEAPMLNCRIPPSSGSRGRTLPNSAAWLRAKSA